MELTIGLAFIAGIVSFLSPCVLPLVPAYIGYMGGRVTNTVAALVRGGTPQRARFSTGVHGLFFVAGFTLVFVTIGLLSTAFIQQVGGSNINHVTAIIGRLGGVVIVFFGLHFMGLMPKFFARLRAHERTLDTPLIGLLVGLAGAALLAWGFTGTLTLWNTLLWDTNTWIPTTATVLIALLGAWLVLGGAFTRPGAFWNGVITRFENALYSDTRRQMAASGKQGYAGSTLMGVVFAAGWTPCIGPVYGAVLTLAASGGDVGRAGTLLAAYSVGLGVPFLITALMLDSAQGTLRRLQRQMRRIELASGTFLIVIGLFVASGQLQRLSARFASDFAEFSADLEDRVIGFFTGEETNAADGTNEVQARDTVPAANRQVGLDIGDLAPDFQTVTDTGEPVALSDLRGQVVLLNFWATWCGPCRVEMPAFQTQYSKLRNDGFTILAVNFAESPEAVRDFRAEFGLTFPLALDDRGAIQAQYGIFSYPSTLLIDREGVIVAKHFGDLSEAQIGDLVRGAVGS